MKNSTKLIASTVLAAASLGSLPLLAEANTVKQVLVERSAYVIRAPHLGAGREFLEPPGAKLTVLSGGTKYWWHVTDNAGHTGYITTNSHWTTLANVSVSASTPVSSTSTNQLAGSATGTSTQVSTTPVFTLPPGVTLDSSVTPIAPTTASNAQKFAAIMQVAQSKLGTPYIWGHNEDRGQFGFDCSNFTSYVYHHALGYKMSGASQTQYHSVGWSIPTSQMQPGDLIIFNQGGHVGIYAGNNQVIQEGGGLKKVGYLSIAPGSYWNTHITVVKRMF